MILTEDDHLKVHRLAMLCSVDSVMRSKQAFAVKRLMKGNFSGMHHTDATKEIIKAKRAMQVITEESNHKRSIALKGRTFTDEHKSKIKASWHLTERIMPSFKGQHHSEESRKKMAEARRLYWERKRLCQVKSK